MKFFLSIAVLLSLILFSCSKKQAQADSHSAITDTPAKPSDDYVKYSIQKGAQYCNETGYVAVEYSELAFKVRFDSSSIYKNKDAKNQGDINKLLGFSDNNALHHQYSARFGWRWSNNALRLFAYVYNASVMSCKEAGTVKIGDENNCSIKVNGDTYIFTLNNQQVTMPRASTTPFAEGYKLFPYFGGDEVAPHPISIFIKEIKK
jgi:hypothetical protein